MKNIPNNKLFRLIILIILIVSDSCALTFSSFIQSDNERVVSTKFNGYIEEYFVNEGDVVKDGDKLIKIDSKEITSSKVQLEASLSQAKLNLQVVSFNAKKALDDFIRYRNLFDKQMVSKTEFENIELNRNSLKSQVEIAKENIKSINEQLSEVNEQLSYLDIKATGKFMVIEKKLNVGELATAGAPILVLSDLDNLVLYLDVAENDLSVFELNKEIDLTIDSLNMKQKAQVIAILPRASGMGSFRVKLKLIEPDKKILPGMFAKVEIE